MWANKKNALWLVDRTLNTPTTPFAGAGHETLLVLTEVPVTTLVIPDDIRMEVGNVVRLSVQVFQSGAAVTSAPSTVTVTVVTPRGASTTYTLAGSQVIQSSVSAFYYDLTVSQAGDYRYTWKTTGPVAVASGFVTVVDPAAH